MRKKKYKVECRESEAWVRVPFVWLALDKSFAFLDPLVAAELDQ